MANDRATKDVVVRHLFEAIDRVREDVNKVELWASAVSGFARPVPDYDSAKVNIWLPREQAIALDDNEEY